jgi:hypothetical protein
VFKQKPREKAGKREILTCLFEYQGLNTQECSESRKLLEKCIPLHRKAGNEWEKDSATEFNFTKYLRKKLESRS